MSDSPDGEEVWRGEGDPVITNSKILGKVSLERNNKQPGHVWGEGLAEEEEADEGGERDGEGSSDSEFVRFPFEYKLRDASNPGRPLHK